MGIELVEGRDLVVENHIVYMKTTAGLQQVDVIYRRVDDEYLDPLVFEPSTVFSVFRDYCQPIEREMLPLSIPSATVLPMIRLFMFMFPK